ncbi:MAG: CHC2 zinc finger domain-containing protein [Prevotella sp.]|jgi:DNA primase catalytic core|nr:CHC2 zinc finger domain-containing protein [Prevotella sp.]
MIKEQIIESILESTDLQALIEEHVPGIHFKRVGRQMMACCPFHQEKTASFAVDNEKGVYYCFGCRAKGNAITFLKEHEKMTFKEAVKYLGGKLGITIAEHEESLAEREARMKRESLLATVQTMQEIYVGELSKSKEAQDYVYRRWGKEYCEMIGVGFSNPNGMSLSARPMSRGNLEELQCLNSMHGDKLRGRITIPIRDRFGKTIAFTARAIDDSTQPKYLNSNDSPIYSKRRSLFGIHYAIRTASSERKMFLVEGAPDCMRLQSIGVANTVADLGTAWTPEQFAIIHRFADNVCFLPDADPPKAGEHFGPGLKAVFRSGAEAIRQGLYVTVKEIPQGQGKQDPDTYYKDIATFRRTEEQDFFLWLAGKKYPYCNTPADKPALINEIASLLVHITDPTKLSMIIEDLKPYGSRQIWNKAVSAARKKEKEKNPQAKAHAESEQGIMEEFGFGTRNDHYFSVTDSGSTYEWSNFTLEPLFLIKDNEAPKRIFNIRNEYGRKELVILNPEDLVSVQAFRKSIERLGNFLWKATDRELIKLKAYLFKETEEAWPIQQLGWQRDGFYAFGNGVYDGKAFIPTDDYGIVRVSGKGIYYLPSNSRRYRKDPKFFAFEHRFVHENLSAVTMREFTGQFFLVYGDNARVGYAYLLATLFRDVVFSEEQSFPILNLFGPKGSGKSQMGQTLMSFFIKGNKGASMSNSTVPALAAAVGAVSNALVHLEEYKNSLDPRRTEFLKGLWDGIGRTRMNMDLDKKAETTPVNAGIILSGQEMPTVDIALFTRLIFLSFPRSEFTIEEKRNHKQLMKMISGGLTHLTLQILSHRKLVEDNFSNMYRMTFEEIAQAVEDVQVEDRIVKNWVAPLAMFRTLETSLNISLSYGELFRICVEGIKLQGKESKTSSELGGFWNIMQYLVSEGDLLEDGDFKIKYIRQFKSDKMDVDWKDTRPVLFLQKSRIFMLYKKNERSAGDDTIPEESLKYYIEKSREFLGTKNVRFKKYLKGVRQYDPLHPDATLTSTQRAYCFDYTMLQKVYGINFDNGSNATVDVED